MNTHTHAHANSFLGQLISFPVGKKIVHLSRELKTPFSEAEPRELKTPNEEYILGVLLKPHLKHAIDGESIDGDRWGSLLKLERLCHSPLAWLIHCRMSARLAGCVMRLCDELIPKDGFHHDLGDKVSFPKFHYGGKVITIDVLFFVIFCSTSHLSSPQFESGFKFPQHCFTFPLLQLLRLIFYGLPHFLPAPFQSTTGRVYRSSSSFEQSKIVACISEAT